MELTFLEKLYLRNVLSSDFKAKRMKLAVRNEDDIIAKCLKEDKQQDLDLLNKLCEDYEFVCEICGNIFSKDLEGAEPNTCRECNPERKVEEYDAE